MTKKPIHTDFTRFLKDERFIEWKLFPSEELDAYWKEYLTLYPLERDAFELAERHFENIHLSSYKPTDKQREQAIRELQESLRAYRVKRRIRRFSYVAAACVVTLLLLYLQKEMTQLGQEGTTSTNYIVGSELEQEDILFITQHQTSTFQGNVNIAIENDQTAKVRSKDGDERELAIEKQAMNQLIVPHGKRSEIVLADGTKVWLNSGSSIEFPSTFSNETREVLLSGEIYVEVAPDKKRPFIVHTPDYKVKAYGTQFNVSVYAPSSSSVILVEGSVGVQAGETKEVMLSPNEQAIYTASTETFETRSVEVLAYTSWKDGYLTFNDTPVTEVLKQIERYYNLSFNLDEAISFKGITCTGKIILSENLDNVMTTLSLISGTKYKRENRTIYIYKNVNETPMGINSKK